MSWIARQSKHAAVGYPFVTMLLCLEENISFNAYVDLQMDHLQRQLKVCIAPLGSFTVADTL